MAHHQTAGAAARSFRPAVPLALVVLGATLFGIVGGQFVGPSRGEADGVVRSGLTVFDIDTPAVARLDPDLLDALRHAAADAASHGVEIVINSGWRSSKYQEHLLDSAVLKYGSQQEATRWVATAKTSSHVSGDAVDVGPSRAAAWLSRHGAEYGLCRIYRNEPWHFELRLEASEGGCPPMYSDARRDRRTQRPPHGTPRLPPRAP